ncbi:acetyl-CoA acetyltransferase [Streptomyces alfalfae]|uniref:Acetyl-CoA acetyltransferase n=1 Tax=Streptomyces alfalfae TaxID=1642299 RepID=A0ABN4VMI7_9ACTN|nr:acetyl-CoA acetyltransferase [Streptomyces alfalfae]AYA18155.1 acetyl-CoA acetyltransferase [Streptomyces fradiae]APY87728.1 acetyl-CoA acetyltransferase [Streptomyces alfalfae]QUI32291.1 acetyl-CoA acetyltransferase [Streptomyces alfalfae]RXX40272.1 acetyl-CoA acetyltransferase [Streptomyces alfalfae]RZM87036.1 acetyl-CoA acetyltransferase [Streptomyces alfalfae]
MSAVTRSTPRKVAAVGVALSDCGRVDEATPYALHAQAARRALADSGLGRDVIDGIASAGLGALAPVEVAEYLGLRPRWVDSTSVGGATWEVMAAHAAEAIAAGRADAVLLVYGSTARADIRAGRRTSNLSYGARGPLQFEAPYGHSLIAKYAMAARRHMHEYGTTLEQLASVAVQARANAAANPDAMYREPVTVDEVLAGPMIADPFTKLHCCIRSDGGCAVLLAAEEYVTDCASLPVWVLGAGEHVSHAAMSQWEDFTVSPAAVSGRLAFERAGVRPADIDLAEIYDAFTYMTLVTLEDLGFCGKGEGGAFVEKGRLLRDGGLPTNTDGGGLSAQHPGMRGLFLLVEAVRQLRGQAGERQVHRRDGSLPELAVASGTGGWFCSSGTVVLGRG